MAKPVITDKPVIDQAQFGDITIWRKEGGSIEVSDTNYPSMKAALRDIADKAGIKLEEDWNTQYMGWYIIQQLKGERSDEHTSCFYDDFIFQFQYDGKKLYAFVNSEKDILTNDTDISGDYHLSGKKIEDHCNDVDELAVAIAKKLIISSSDIVYSVFSNEDDLLFEDISLTKDYVFKKSSECDFQLQLFGGNLVSKFTYAGVEEKQLEDIQKLMYSNDEDSLYNLICDDVSNEIYEVFNIGEGERVEYSIFDDQKDTVEEGALTINEQSDIFKYQNRSEKTVKPIRPFDVKSEYMLVCVEQVDNPYCSFNVPRDFQINNLHFALLDPPFIGENVFSDYPAIWCECHYLGEELEQSEFDDWGDGDERKFYLLKKSATGGAYDILASLSEGDYTRLTPLSIPKGVTEIQEYEFTCRGDLTSVVLPESVKKIGCSAFEDCHCLISVVLPKSLEEIGYAAFKNCGLTSITIPDGVSKIDGEAFLGCRSLITIDIPESVTEVGDWAFDECTKLKSVTISKHSSKSVLQAFEGLGVEIVKK